MIGVTAGFEHSEPSRILHLDSGEMVLILLGAAAVVVMSCWAAALFGTVVRATIGGMVAFACLGASAAISVWCASRLGGLQTDFVSSLSEGLRLAHNGDPRVDGVIVMSALMVAALWQGFLQFRRAQVPGNLWVKYLAILILVVVVASAWLVDLSVSAEGLSDLSVRQEVEPAAQAVVATKPDLGPGKWQVIGLADLEEVASLSERVKARLRDARISLMIVPPGAPRAPRICQVIIAFPAGATQMFGFPLQNPKGK
jgi:hypothetical protein